MQKCKAWSEWVADLFLLCVSLVFNLFVAQKLQMFLVSRQSNMTLVKKVIRIDGKQEFFCNMQSNIWDWASPNEFMEYVIMKISARKTKVMCISIKGMTKVSIYIYRWTTNWASARVSVLRQSNIRWWILWQRNCE